MGMQLQVCQVADAFHTLHSWTGTVTCHCVAPPPDSLTTPRLHNCNSILSVCISVCSRHCVATYIGLCSGGDTHTPEACIEDPQRPWVEEGDDAEFDEEGEAALE